MADGPRRAASASRARTIGRVVRRVGRPVEGARREFGRHGVIISSALMFPGLCARLAARVLAARALSARVQHTQLSYAFGGSPVIDGTSVGARRAFILLAPSFLLVALGVALALPVALEAIFFSVNIAPDDISADGLRRVIVERLVVRGETQAGLLWFAVSCWYAAALSPEDVRDGVESIRAADGPAAIKGIAMALVGPIRLLSRLTDPLDRYIQVASGAVSVGLWAVATIGLSRAIL